MPRTSVSEPLDLSRRADRVRLAALLSAGGMPTREIARRLGLRPGTVRDYRWDPEREHRTSPRERCPCGVKVSGPGRCCPGCAADLNRRWDEPSVLAAFAEFERRFGRVACSTDWARSSGPEARGRLEEVRCPSPATVIRIFGSFGAARARYLRERM